METLDRAALEREGLHTEAERLTVMWAALLSPFTGDPLLIALDRLGLHTHNKYPLRARVIDALREAKPAPLTDADLRRLADVLPLPILLRVRAARFAEAPSAPDLRRADVLGVLDGPCPACSTAATSPVSACPPGRRWARSSTPPARPRPAVSFTAAKTRGPGSHTRSTPRFERL
ncbi:MAG: hypothetical protein IPO67_20010 [Deltaproteobacteria bacterium]|nr:hypothetical protein [Deltaproteobacteria bacterium]